MLKSPKFDLGALLALHGESSTDDKGNKVRHTYTAGIITGERNILTSLSFAGRAGVQGAGFGVCLNVSFREALIAHV